MIVDKVVEDNMEVTVKRKRELRMRIESRMLLVLLQTSASIR
jgi:hypothetical protein